MSGRSFNLTTRFLDSTGGEIGVYPLALDLFRRVKAQVLATVFNREGVIGWTFLWARAP